MLDGLNGPPSSPLEEKPDEGDTVIISRTLRVTFLTATSPILLPSFLMSTCAVYVPFENEFAASLTESVTVLPLPLTAVPDGGSTDNQDAPVLADHGIFPFRACTV